MGRKSQFAPEARERAVRLLEEHQCVSIEARGMRSISSRR